MCTEEFDFSQPKTRLGSFVARALCCADDLVDAGAGANFSARGEQRRREQVAGLRTVDVPLRRLLVVEAADEEQLFAKVVQRVEHFAQLHVVPFAFGPPLLRVKAIAAEKDGQADRRLLIDLAGPASSAQAGSDSSHGKAIVTPRPRKTERRVRRKSCI